MYICNIKTIDYVLNMRIKKLEMEYELLTYTIIIYLMLWIRFRKKLDIVRIH